jgi:hypothetical protein
MSSPGELAEKAWQERADLSLAEGELPLQRGIIYPVWSLTREVQAQPAYALVSTSRILWSESAWVDGIASLEFDAIDSFARGRQYHRSVLLLRHQPIDQDVIARRRRKWFGIQTPELPTATQTGFMFSRVGTEAETAILDQLALHGVGEGDPLELHESTREERMRGNSGLLRRRRGIRKDPRS